MGNAVQAAELVERRRAGPISTRWGGAGGRGSARGRQKPRLRRARGRPRRWVCPQQKCGWYVVGVRGSGWLGQMQRLEDRGRARSQALKFTPPAYAETSVPNGCYLPPYSAVFRQQRFARILYRSANSPPQWHHSRRAPRPNFAERPAPARPRQAPLPSASAPQRCRDTHPRATSTPFRLPPLLAHLSRALRSTQRAPPPGGHALAA